MSAEVTGPITGGKHGRPFAAAMIDIAAEGYVEEEYFFEGDAPRYQAAGEFGVDGRWAVERAGTSAYKTRALVRRPTDPARFNGTVIVEWNNVSAGIEIFEAGDTPVIFDEGFAYVGVSAQRVGVHGFDAFPQGLRTWDPERYDTLQIDDDGLSYGIFTEVARAFAPDRTTSGVDPLGGLTVRKLLAIGGSQSAGRLVTYINAVHPVEQLFDGFIPFTWFGSGFSIDDPTPLDINAGGLAGLVTHPTQIRDDLGVPVIVVNSECETMSCLRVRQADTDQFRFWEVAGAPHAPRLHMERILPKGQRDGVGMPGEIDLSALSPVPWAPVLDAAVLHTHRWLGDGTPPPSQPRIDIEDGRIHRDSDGNATGGIRVPEQEVTLSCNVGAIEEVGAAGLMGISTALPADVLRSRYADQDAYLTQFAAAAEVAVAAGVLLPRDAADSLERAKERTLP